MGALCCCFHVHDAPDDNASNNSSSNDCSCPKCFFHKLLNKQRSQLNGGQQIRTGQQTRTVSPPNHQASSSNAEVIFDNSSRDSGAHNRDAPDSDSTRLLQERSRQEKTTNRSRVQPEPVGQSGIRMNPKSTQGDKIVVSTSEVETQEQNSQSSQKVEYSFLSLHEVEECPTCLEEYTEENPKIIAKCSHHFHLSCIYEWMERSQECPVCRELMLFDE